MSALLPVSLPAAKSSPTRFDDLPPELIRHIASFLPVSSAAALALCNHSFSNVLGRRYWNAIRIDAPNQRGRARFLQCLVRDLPDDHYFCRICVKIHLPGTHIRRENRRCLGNPPLPIGIAKFYHRGFTFEQALNVMDLYRQGLDIKSCLANLSRVDAHSRGSDQLYLFEPRIVNDELVVRAQHWLLFPAGRDFELPRSGSIDVCVHLATNYGGCQNSNKLRSRLQSAIGHLNSGQVRGAWSPELTQCLHCPSEFQVDVALFADGAAALIVTKWMDLGAMHSPHDVKWRSHFEDSFNVIMRHLRGSFARGAVMTDEQFQGFKAGGIQTAFEQQKHFVFESVVTRQNARRLSSGKKVCRLTSTETAKPLHDRISTRAAIPLDNRIWTEPAVSLDNMVTNVFRKITSAWSRITGRLRRGS